MTIIKTISRWNRDRLARRKQARLSKISPNYEGWVRDFGSLSTGQATALRKHWQNRGPMISVVIPTYNPDIGHLSAAIESVLGQIYQRVEVCIADDASTDPEVRSAIEAFARRDPRVKFVFRERNGHISAASNSALKLACGDFIALLDQDDLLADFALAAVAKAIDIHPEAGLIYSDEDKINDDGQRFDPHFKPQWNAILLRSQNYICHLAVIRRSLIESIGGFRQGFEGSQDHDLVLRCSEKLHDNQIVHIPLVLYHWRVHEGSTARNLGSKPYAQINGCQAIQEHLDRVGVRATAELDGSFYRVRYGLPESLPRVSIILLTRDRPGLLRQCVQSVLKKTRYDNLELIIVDNGTVDSEALELLEGFAIDPRITLLRDPSPFNFSRLNNRAVSHATGDYLCLMNNDVEVLDADWLTEMISVGVQPGIGAVGARLYYPDGTIQHAGVIVGIGGVAGHPFKDQTRDNPHYMARSKLMQELTAVTAACLLTPRRVYEELGGLDETHLAVAFNDVDFCLRLREAGHRIVYNPYVELVHHESVSRGREDTPEKKSRFSGEVRYMQQRWKNWLSCDRAYNPNLTLAEENYAVATRPRIELNAWLSTMHDSGVQ
ncbi:glycosyltransferase family 2 protein [Malikia sp.]|uniref:glycosyltransferase family 2 protein n=1 Tax=Malikia sp. TaxID=2070706 RepID=UPI002627F729|nr:glycosyltransferase family 2 protein [Malikia sp.]MDD2729344.1 glycosyltransferase family 2 protein [Malikia sp.]